MYWYPHLISRCRAVPCCDMLLCCCAMPVLIDMAISRCVLVRCGMAHVIRMIWHATHDDLEKDQHSTARHGTSHQCVLPTAVSIGMAKPIPSPPCAFIVFMPITSPSRFTSGPPELPTLIAASVYGRFGARQTDWGLFSLIRTALPGHILFSAWLNPSRCYDVLLSLQSRQLLCSEV